MNNPLITYYNNHMVVTYTKPEGEHESHIYQEHESKNNTWTVIGGSHSSIHDELLSTEKAYIKINDKEWLDSHRIK